MFLVGLTGGIATGKSTVAEMLTQLGCPLIDADVIAREVVEPGQPAWRDIHRNFGPEVFDERGRLDREKLGAIVFRDEAKRRVLNAITHPRIQRAMLRRALWCFLRGEQFLVLDIPLLLESARFLPYLSYVLVVSCDEQQQLERLKLRSGLSDEDARRRVDAQMPIARKRAMATHVIDNSGDVDVTRRQVLEIHAELRRSWRHWRLRLLLGGAVLSVVGLLLCQFYF